MRVGLSALAERARQSLFVVPTVFVIIGVLAGELGIALDSAISEGATKPPLGLTSTVESARAVLSTVAGATITVAGIAFSVALLTIQLASSQYSPRVVSGLFRDPFNRRVIGLVVGTFSYCLIVLRSVHAPLEPQGQPVIPNVSVAVGVLLGIAAILSIIAFIDHSAHTMDISRILHVVTRDAIGAVDHHWSANLLEPSPTQQPEIVPGDAGLTVRFEHDGWVQLLDPAALLTAVPEGGTIRLETAIGRFAISGSPLCTLWPRPADDDAAADIARGAVRLGEARTLQQDASFGVRQLADVGLKALSPGVNDPTTAQDAIFHLSALLHAFLQRDQPARDLYHDQRRLVLAQADGHEEVIALAYDEIRIAAASQPAVCIYLLESISLLRRSLDRAHERASLNFLGEQASLILAACERSGMAPYDIERVRRIYVNHFTL